MPGRKPHEMIAALLALVSLLGGWPGGAPARLRAELRFQQTTCEVGEVRGGAVLVPRFTFTNVGSTPVEITEVRPGCGCLKPRLWQLMRYDWKSYPSRSEYFPDRSALGRAVAGPTGLASRG